MRGSGRPGAEGLPGTPKGAFPPASDRDSRARYSLVEMNGDPPRRIDRDRVQDLIRDEGAQLVEVLPSDDFEALHLPGAINIPLTDLDRERASRLDRSRPVIVYCYDHQ